MAAAHVEKSAPGQWPHLPLPTTRCASTAGATARVSPEARGLPRDEVRLLVSYRDGDRVVDATFRDLPRFLKAGDLLVVNDSATLPAARTATRVDGSTFALHLSTRKAEDVWVVEPRETSPQAGQPPPPSR